MRILTVVGARPQFVKAAAISRALATAGSEEILVHTGQHYDEAMSGSFFDQLGICPPSYNLEVGSSGHGVQTGAVMARLEPIVQTERPDFVLVYGDTNSTLGAALVAAKLHVPVAHVEAGLRSFDRTMPEEINRVVTDHISDLLFCPSQVAVGNLRTEGITTGIHVVGDVMQEVLDHGLSVIGTANPVAEGLNQAEGSFVFSTIHRPANTDDPQRLEQIVEALSQLAQSGLAVILPAHPRTAGLLGQMSLPSGLHVVTPTTYHQTLALVRGARCIVTDSGGLQKEAYWIGTPCITVRPSTEWVETVDEGWNQLVDADCATIVRAVAAATTPTTPRDAYGQGNAAESIVHVLAQTLDR